MYRQTFVPHRVDFCAPPCRLIEQTSSFTKTLLFGLVPLRLCRLQSPGLFKSGKLDGPTLHAVFYFTLKEETAKALQDLESADPSVRLLAEYFRLVAVAVSCFSLLPIATMYAYTFSEMTSFRGDGSGTVAPANACAGIGVASSC